MRLCAARELSAAMWWALLVLAWADAPGPKRAVARVRQLHNGQGKAMMLPSAGALATGLA